MMRKTFLLFFLLLSLPLFANFVESQPFEHVQPDGIKLSLFVTGDEYYHRVHDAQDYTILLHPETGYAVYAIPDGKSIKASNNIVGTINPSTLGIQPGLMIKSEELDRDFAERQRLREQHRGDPTGTINNVVVMVRFADQTEFPTTRNYSFFDNLYNSTTQQSLKDYYTEISSGQLTINSYVKPPANVNGFVVSIQVTHNRNYYSPYNASTNTAGYHNIGERDSRHAALINEIVIAADPSIDNALDLDNDDDGYVDAITFVFRGATDNWGDLLWPTQWWFTSSVSTLNGSGIIGWDNIFEGGIGSSVICHEMAHMIGAPDLYHYSNAPMGNHAPWKLLRPVAGWDLMASDNAQHWTTYMKWKYGTWFTTIPTITPTSTPTTYALTAIDQNPYSCYKINSSFPGQYYMLEYRRQSGRYEVGVPNSGLIVYRIISSLGGTAITGNSQGPPDEVYVYRPGGVVNTYGEPNNANFSLQSGRVELHNLTDPKPWLYSDTLSTNDGNLVITGVGASGGTTISFTIQNSIPKIWTGAVSDDWNTAGNWKNGIPTTNDNADIPSNSVRFPYINTAHAYCKNLQLQSGAVIFMGNYNLYVNGNFNIKGTLAMMGATGPAVSVNVTGKLIWESGSNANITNPNSSIYVSGDLEFKAGSNVNISTGTITFNGSVNSNLNVFATSYINNLINNKTVGSVYYTSISTADLYIRGNFTNYTGRAFYANSNYTTHFLGSNINNYGTAEVQFNAGTFVLEGSNNVNLTNENTNSNFYNFTINKPGYSVNLNGSLTVLGTLSLTNGYLQAGANNITVGGFWNDMTMINQGVEGFIQGTSSVTFNGTSIQQVYGSAHFYNFTINKTAGEVVFTNLAQITADHYTWMGGAYRMEGGSFLVNDLVNVGIMGTITINSGTVEYHQDSSAWIDLRGNLTIHNGSFSIYGGSGPCWFSYVDTATLTMDGGTLDFKNVGIYIPGSYPFNDNISGGRIRTAYGFSCDRTDFNPTGGTIELYGTADAELHMPVGTNSNFYNLEIIKAARNDDMRDKNEVTYNRAHRLTIPTRTNAVTGTGHFIVKGIFGLYSGTFTAPDTIVVGGNWINTVGPAAFIEGTKYVEFNGSGHQYVNNNENFYSLKINKVGALRVNNTSAVVTCATYTWTAGAVDVLTGTFTANELTQNGIYGNFYVNPGGTINLYQDAGSWLDLNGFLYNYGGTINIYGGSIASDLAWSANAGITMTSGTIDFKNKGIDFHITSYALTINVTGGVLRANGGSIGERASVCFGGGTFELYGPGNYSVSHGTGGYFYNLTINKSVSRDDVLDYQHEVFTVESNGKRETYDYRLEGVIANTNLVVQNSLLVSAGIFNVNGKIIEAYNDVTVYGILTMTTSGSVIYCIDDFSWMSGSTSNVSIGELHCWGNWYFYNGSAAQLTGCTTELRAEYGANLITSSSNSWFGDLTINGGDGGEGCIYSLTSSSADSLRVSGALYIYEENGIDLYGRRARINGSTTVNSTGSLVLGSNGYILIKSSLTLSGELNVGNGYAEVRGIYTSANTTGLYITGGSFINNVPWVRDISEPETNRSTVELKGAIQLTGGLLEITNNTVVIRTHGSRTWSGGIVRIGAGFSATEAGAFYQNGGTLELVGLNNPVLAVSSDNYIYNLTVNKSSNSYSAFLQNNTIIKNNVLIAVGGITTNNFNLTVGGYWTNNAGTAGFSEGTGTVSFTGSSAATGVLSSETFYNLVLNNSSTNWDNFEISGGSTVNVTNDLTITDGTLNLKYISGLYVGRDITIASGAGINAQNGGPSTISVGRHWNDSNATYSDATGYYTGISTLIFTGSSASTITIAASSFLLFNFTINKTAGVNVSLAKPLQVYGNCSINSGTLYDTVTGLTHEFRGNFIIGTNGLWNSSALNTIAFKGTSAQLFSNSGSSYIYNLTVDKSAGTVSLGSNILALNGGTITINAGTIDLNHFYLRTTGNINIYSTGKISIDTDAWLELANNKTLSVNIGGVLELIGTSGHTAKLTRQSGTYAVNIETGGTISAEYAVFEYLGTNGVYIKSGALVDAGHSFNNCTFQLGASGGTLLRIDNNQTINISNAVFPTNTWSGTNNVKKTINQGIVNFNAATGGFSGAGYESDPYSRINWINLLPVPDIAISFIQASNSIRLEWTYPVTVTRFNIYRSTNPAGPFTSLAGYSTTHYYTETASGLKYFYIVKAEQ